MKDRLNNLKQSLTNGWNFLRLARLVLALVIIAEGWYSSEMLFAIFGGWLALQTLLNFGCCGTSGCGADYSKPGSQAKNGEVVYEEVK